MGNNTKNQRCWSLLVHLKLTVNIILAQIIHSLCPLKLSMWTTTPRLFLGIVRSYEDDYSYWHYQVSLSARFTLGVCSKPCHQKSFASIILESYLANGCVKCYMENCCILSVSMWLLAEEHLFQRLLERKDRLLSKITDINFPKSSIPKV